jgi:hypothetical protein
MSSQSHDTISPPDTRWATEIVPQLPADLDLQAAKLGGLRRRRCFPNAATLLRGLLAYALQASSLAQLAAWGLLSDTTDITASSWLKRLRASTAWLTWLLNSLLGGLPASWLTSFGHWRPLIIDLSDIGIVGGTGNDLRLHICYDLLAGQFAQLHLTERSHGEDLSIWKLTPRDILIVDAGYGYRSKIAAVVASLAQIVTRIYLPTCPLLDRQAKPLDLVRQLERRGQTPLEVPAQVEHGGKLIDVRVLAVPLPADQRNRAQQRLCKKARRNGRTASPTGTLLAGWMVLLTTLPPDPWTAEAIVGLYRARWQVEIVIKRFKQLLELPVLRCRTVASGVPLLTLSLIGWVLSSGLVAELHWWRSCGRRSRQRRHQPQRHCRDTGQWPMQW